MMDDQDPQDSALIAIAESFTNNLKAIRDESIESDQRIRRGDFIAIENETPGPPEQADGSTERQESHGTQ